ncbi:MAG: hypothetical protein ACTSX7_02920 [Alphaproteobacteria bacterium]
MTVRRLASRLYNLPPREVVHQIRRRIPLLRKTEENLDRLLNGGKVRPGRPYDFLSRYQAIVARQHAWPHIDFTDACVIELGCGPLLGWGPLAVFLGCKRFVAVEPGYNAAIPSDPRIVARYFRPMFKDLCAIYGTRFSFDAFMAALAQRIEPVATEFLKSEISGPFDLSLSNSCLEHIFPLAPSLQRLGELSTPTASFLHLVDFGNHRDKAHPFAGLYDLEPDAYLARHGQAINLHRAPDILAMFHTAGLPATLVPYYFARETHTGTLAPYWRRRYDDAALFLKAGLFVGPIDHAAGTPAIP